MEAANPETVNPEKGVIKEQRLNYQRLNLTGKGFSLFYWA